MENRVRELRKGKRLTQTELAKELGVSLSTIQNWEAAKTDMTGYSLLMLCNYFSVSPDEVYGTGKPSNEWLMQQRLVDLFRSVDKTAQSVILKAVEGIVEACQAESSSIGD